VVSLPHSSNFGPRGGAPGCTRRGVVIKDPCRTLAVAPWQSVCWRARRDVNTRTVHAWVTWTCVWGLGSGGTRNSLTVAIRCKPSTNLFSHRPTKSNCIANARWKCAFKLRTAAAGARGGGSVDGHARYTSHANRYAYGLWSLHKFILTFTHISHAMAMGSYDSDRNTSWGLGSVMAQAGLCLGCREWRRLRRSCSQTMTHFRPHLWSYQSSAPHASGLTIVLP
jgi:hypothetical protein